MTCRCSPASGHEIDRSVADEVAHTACKTPTACAQLLVRRVDEFVGRARPRVAAGGRAGPSAHGRRRRASSTTPRAARAGARPAAVAREQTRLDRAHGRLDELARRRTVDLGAQLDGCARRVAELGRRATRDRRAALVARERELVTHAQHHLERAALRLDVAARPSCARSTRAGCWSAATRSPATPTAGWCARSRRRRRRRAGRDRARGRTRHQPRRVTHRRTQQE